MRSSARVCASGQQARAVVAALEKAGIAPNDIVTISDADVCERWIRAERASIALGGASLGALAGGGAGLLAWFGLLAIPGLGPVVAAGVLTVTALGAAVGALAGGLVGALGLSPFAADDSRFFCAAVRRGGTMVGVRFTRRQAAQVAQIMSRDFPVDSAASANDAGRPFADVQPARSTPTVRRPARRALAR